MGKNEPWRQKGTGSMTSRNKRLLALLILLCAVGALLLADRTITPVEATWQQALLDAKEGHYQLIHTDEIRQISEEAPHKMLLVDVRPREQFRVGHIPGAVNLPLKASLWSQWWGRSALEAFLGSDKKRFIVLYCAGLTSARSAFAARAAAELGYTNVYRDAKGFSDWLEEGLPVFRSVPGSAD